MHSLKYWIVVVLQLSDMQIPNTTNELGYNSRYHTYWLYRIELLSCVSGKFSNTQTTAKIVY